MRFRKSAVPVTHSGQPLEAIRTQGLPEFAATEAESHADAVSMAWQHRPDVKMWVEAAPDAFGDAPVWRRAAAEMLMTMTVRWVDEVNRQGYDFRHHYSMLPQDLALAAALSVQMDAWATGLRKIELEAVQTAIGNVMMEIIRNEQRRWQPDASDAELAEQLKTEGDAFFEKWQEERGRHPDMTDQDFAKYVESSGLMRQWMPMQDPHFPNADE